ncbi:uncharacterized protein LOC117929162 isoform X1 [Vitis riparia]|uniref:uncharacterized protein LOC117929162 isoform X1 n=1 Tax=Vitis riparia TaxID=96939 RepID=UPI00155B3358|nr:uncharacterized protein LOC117929162 isoform X1 [Vitis riparia]
MQVYETIPIIGMKYANHVAKSCPWILNWSATSTSRFTELQQIFLDYNLPFTDPKKRRKIRKEGETTFDFNHLQYIFEEAREAFHKWLSLQQGKAPCIFSKFYHHRYNVLEQNVKARWEKHAKKWNQFQMQADDILINYVNGLHPILSMKWSEVDIIYVPINV